MANLPKLTLLFIVLVVAFSFEFLHAEGTHTCQLPSVSQNYGMDGWIIDSPHAKFYGKALRANVGFEEGNFKALLDIYYYRLISREILDKLAIMFSHQQPMSGAEEPVQKLGLEVEAGALSLRFPTLPQRGSYTGLSFGIGIITRAIADGRISPSYLKWIESLEAQLFSRYPYAFLRNYDELVVANRSVFTEDQMLRLRTRIMNFCFSMQTYNGGHFLTAFELAGTLKPFNDKELLLLGNYAFFNLGASAYYDVMSFALGREFIPLAVRVQGFDAVVAQLRDRPHDSDAVKAIEFTESRLRRLRDRLATNSK